MKETFEDLMDQIQNLMIALDAVPSFRDQSPEVIALKKELAQVSRTRLKLTRMMNARIIKVRPLIAQNPIPKNEFWDAFDRSMAHVNRK